MGHPCLVKWTVTDNSGRICSFDIYAMAADSWIGQDENQEDYGRLLLSLRTTQPTPYNGQVVDTFTDYDGSFGGGGDTAAGWYMIAKDCSGNTTTAEVHSLSETTVLQEDNRKAYNDATDPGTIAYSGSWSAVLHLRVLACHATDNGQERQRHLY